MGIYSLKRSTINSFEKYSSFLAGNEAIFDLFAGYFAGGGINENSTGSIVDKFAFPSDTRSTLGTGLSTNVSGVSGMANSNVAGYIGSQFNASFTTKFAFSNDTRSIINVGIEFGRDNYAAHANSGVAGYFFGGRRGDTIQGTDRGTKFIFATDTTSNFTPLDFPREGSAGMANSGVAGYTCGGRNSQSTATVANVRKLAYPADTSSNLGTGLSAPTLFIGAMANSGVAGYTGGGVNNQNFTRTTVVNKFAFPSDSRSILGTGLSIGRMQLAGMAHSGIAGYFGGGTDGGSTTHSTVDKYSFSNDTRSTLGTGLSSVRNRLAAMATSGVL